MKKKKTQGRGKKKILTLKTEKATTKKGGKGSESYLRFLAVERKKTNKQTNKQRRLTIERGSGVKDEEKKEKAIPDSWLEKKKNSKEDNKSENDDKEERGKKREGHT